ncbi:phosphoadenosine phosphosulfate reductase family protein [Fontisphaera persica]|uniref:phosphoadenosine phosphosulfate reductase domain-containing protein n=1 Tax=Fontisphaera persica TaxID=2974023 RepID=UPI0024BF2E1A|nr:phosphoadenosine phosphosulfate reductase family protein [Fontisphaera persica]WCJ57908.1 phosphoadenosine phosphosulfate reductase family protein [Fontisphaera persica]
MFTDAEISQWNRHWQGRPVEEIVEWALLVAKGRAVVTTNFRAYEAVLLHLVTRVQPDIPVLWVDHGWNRPATYRHAEDLTRRLRLNLKVYTPTMTVARYQALHGAPPTAEQEEALRQFSQVFKLEPFQRAMREMAPAVWLTALRRVQNPHRAGMEMVVRDAQVGVLKVSPLVEWTDEQMAAYVQAHDLPVEWDYFDPAKGDEKRECGLHVRWGQEGKGA